MGAKFDNFAVDQVAQLKMAAAAYEAALGPQGKYDLGVRELNSLAQSGLIDEEAKAAAMAELNVQLVKAADATHKLQEEEQKLLERSASAAAGFRAFLIQTQISANENARFIFDALNAATTGGENTAADSLIKIIESHKEQHAKLIHQLRQMWESYFAGLAKMAIQHGLQKLLEPAASFAGSLFKEKKADAFAPTAPGAATGLGAMVGGAGKNAALTGNTAALEHLTAVISAKGGGSFMIPGMGGPSMSAGGAGMPDVMNLPSNSFTPLSGLAMFAAGGDVSPGGSFISGEAGAERVDLERGGAHVTPLGVSAGGGGSVVHNYDLRGAVVTDDLLRKAEAAQMMAHTHQSAVNDAVSISRESGLRARPQR